MKVQELIDKLETFDPDLPVSVFSMNGEYDEPLVSLVVKVRVKSQKFTAERITITAERDD